MSRIPKPQITIIDRIVNFFDPVAGMKRTGARTMQAIYGSYVGARFDRRSMRDWAISPGSADSDTLWDLPWLRMRSRDLVRNNPLAGGAVNTVVQNAVGTGLALQPTPDTKILGWTEEQASSFASQVESEFNLWAESNDCDRSRGQNFYGLTNLAFRSCLENGDVFAALPFVKRDSSPYSLAVQLIEGDRVMNPYGIVDGGYITAADGSKSANQVWGGIEVDSDGAPVNYIIFRKHPGSPDFFSGDGQKWDRIPAYGSRTGRKNVLHIIDRRRVDQKRGIPYLAPVIEPLKQLGKYTDAEIMAAVVSSMFTVFVKTPMGEGLGTLPSPPPAPVTGPAGFNLDRTDPNREIALGTGAIIDLAQGEDVSFANPNRPNTAFDPFVMSILRQIGVALELPFEVLIKHFTASYSAARAALIEAWKLYKSRRDFISTYFCQPVYEAWFEEAVALGRISAPGFFRDPRLRRAYLSAEWVGDAPGSLDPVKDVTAAQQRVEMGISTIKKEAMEMNGVDWMDVHRQRVIEHDIRVKAGLEPEIGGAIVRESLTGQAPSQPGAPQPQSDGSDVEKPEDAQ